MLNAKERKRLGDVLALTASTHDGEAIAAMRTAHAYLHEHGLTIRDVVSGKHLDLAPALSFLLKQLATEQARVAWLQQALAARKPAATPQRNKRACQHCGKLFAPKNHGRVPKYCSVACRQAANGAGWHGKRSSWYNNHSV